MLIFKRMILIFIMFFIMISLISCQQAETPDPMDQTDPTLPTVSIPAMFNDGFDFIRGRDSYHVHTMLDIDSDNNSFITKHRHTVLFADSFLKANIVNDLGEIYTRVGIIDGDAYHIYKQGSSFIKGDELTDIERRFSDYDQPVFGLLRSTTVDKITLVENVGMLSYTYEEMLNKNPFILYLIDEWMKLEISEDPTPDLTLVDFNITVTMNDGIPVNFQRISIDIKDYLAVKFPLSSIPQDQYRDAKLIFDFAYDTYTKDITSDTQLIEDDHPNALQPNHMASISIKQDMTTLGQYQHDFDWFKLILTEPKTLTFLTNETLHTVYSFYNQNDLTKQIGLFDGSSYALQPGTYYICVQTTHDVSQQMTFSLNEQ